MWNACIWNENKVPHPKTIPSKWLFSNSLFFAQITSSYWFDNEYNIILWIANSVRPLSFYVNIDVCSAIIDGRIQVVVILFSVLNFKRTTYQWKDSLPFCSISMGSHVSLFLHKKVNHFCCCCFSHHKQLFSFDSMTDRPTDQIQSAYFGMHNAHTSLKWQL